MPRFVLLEHDHPQRHWDLMLEAGTVLRTWRLAEPLPSGKVVAATAVPDHRLLYLEYEGPISGGRGSVVRCERGTFSGAVQGEQLVVRLDGERHRGTLCLVQEEGDVWHAEFRADAEQT